MVCKNPIHPQPTPDRRDRIGEGRLDLPRPLHLGCGPRSCGQQVVHQGHHREQPKEARHQSQHRCFGPAPRRLQAKAVRSGSLCGRRCLMLLLTCLFENSMSRRMVAEYARLHLLMPTTAGAGCFPPAIAPRAWQSLPHALAQLGRCRYLAQQREQRIHLDQLADCHHLPLHVVEQLLVGNLLRLTCLVRRQVGAHDLQRELYISRQNDI